MTQLDQEMSKLNLLHGSDGKESVSNPKSRRE